MHLSRSSAIAGLLASSTYDCTVAPICPEIEAAPVTYSFTTAALPADMPTSHVDRDPSVALAGGVVLLIGAEADAAQLTREQNHDAGQLITGLSRETALNRASAINTRAAVGWTATGVGLAASGFGIWWLTQHPAQAAVVLPTPNGALLAVRF